VDVKEKKQEATKNIYLIGFMGVGKSAIGRRLAHELDAQFTDSDQAIEQQAGLTVKQIFEQSGEATFREYERRFVETGHPASGQVIACGGGLAVQPGMLAQLKQRGIVVSLFASEATILKRTRKNKQRPLLNVENPAEKIGALLQERSPIYMQANVCVATDGRSINDVVQHIKRACEAMNS
jgi:shikimate kinase